MALRDNRFTLNLAHNNDNNVTDDVCIDSFVCDNFKRFGNYLYIDVMHSSLCNTKEFCCIASVVKNEIGTINVVCEGFVITGESWFKMCPLRGKNNFHAIFYMILW